MSNAELSIRFWNNVNDRRVKLGLTWDGLGKKIGTSAQSLVTMRNARRCPTIGYALALANILEVSLDYLCTQEGPTSEEEIEGKKIDDVLSILTSRLSEDNVLLLTLIAQQMIEIQQNSKPTHEADQISEEEAPYGVKKSNTLIDKLKKRYL